MLEEVCPKGVDVHTVPAVTLKVGQPVMQPLSAWVSSGIQTLQSGVCKGLRIPGQLMFTLALLTAIDAVSVKIDSAAKRTSKPK